MTPEAKNTNSTEPDPWAADSDELMALDDLDPALWQHDADEVQDVGSVALDGAGFEKNGDELPPDLAGEQRGEGAGHFAG
jgi:hypothetical protein